MVHTHKFAHLLIWQPMHCTTNLCLTNSLFGTTLSEFALIVGGIWQSPECWLVAYCI